MMSICYVILILIVYSQQYGLWKPLRNKVFSMLGALPRIPAYLGAASIEC
jgi:hypothetical protein